MSVWMRMTTALDVPVGAYRQITVEPWLSGCGSPTLVPRTELTRAVGARSQVGRVRETAVGLVVDPPPAPPPAQPVSSPPASSSVAPGTHSLVLTRGAGDDHPPACERSNARRTHRGGGPHDWFGRGRG